jgi:hypothetical protein
MVALVPSIFIPHELGDSSSNFHLAMWSPLTYNCFAKLLFLLLPEHGDTGYRMGLLLPKYGNDGVSSGGITLVKE